MTGEKRTTLIVNPAARVLPSKRSLTEAIGWLDDHGWHVTAVSTEAAGHATVLARQAAEQGQPLLMVCGGDGTISEAAHGLAGSDTALIVIPAGTARVWAKEARLPRRPQAAVRLAEEGQVHRIDLGCADGRHFLLMAGVGLDGRIAEAVSGRAKHYLGAMAYAIAGLRETLRYKSTSVTVQLDEETFTVQLLMMVIGNTRNYAGITEVTSEALADDGLLDVCIFQGRGTSSIVAHLLRVAARKHSTSHSVIYRKVRKVEIASELPLPVQLDGDFWSDRPKTFEVAPQALRVILPKGSRLPILRST